MNARRSRILFAQLSLVSPQSHSRWQEQTRRMLPLFYGLAESLPKDNIQCLVWDPFSVSPAAELEGLKNPAALESLFLDENQWHLWLRYAWEDISSTPFFLKYLNLQMDRAGLDFILIPVVRESLSWLERWRHDDDFRTLSGRIIFVSFGEEITELRDNRGFTFVNLPSECQRLVRILEGPKERGFERWGDAAPPRQEAQPQPMETMPLEAATPREGPLSIAREETLSIGSWLPASEERPLAAEEERRQVRPTMPPPTTPSPRPSAPMSTRAQKRTMKLSARKARLAQPVKQVKESVPRVAPPLVQTEVFLAAATPRVVVPGTDFVARFAAYVEKFRQQVSTIFAKEAPRSEALLDLGTCRWRVGTQVSVRLSARSLIVKPGTQSFTWQGQYEMLRFDVEVPPDCRATQAVLKFDIVIDGVIIATLRPEIEITRSPEAGRAMTVETTEIRSPRSAFASYATRDRRSVLGRVRSLQIHTGIDVFFDCLSIRPGEQWKREIVNQIRSREVFWLFWSRRARKSDWVEWEWRQALAAKSLRGIQPHPLEPSDVAPPPPELAELQFGTAYECYLGTLQESWFKYKLHRIKDSLSRLFRN
jgi:hypothetical protein